MSRPAPIVNLPAIDPESVPVIGPKDRETRQIRELRALIRGHLRDPEMEMIQILVPLSKVDLREGDATLQKDIVDAVRVQVRDLMAAYKLRPE